MTNSSGTHHRYKVKGKKKNLDKMSKHEKKKFFMRQSSSKTGGAK